MLPLDGSCAGHLTPGGRVPISKRTGNLAHTDCCGQCSSAEQAGGKAASLFVAGAWCQVRSTLGSGGDDMNACMRAYVRVCPCIETWWTHVLVASRSTYWVGEAVTVVSCCCWSAVRSCLMRMYVVGCRYRCTHVVATELKHCLDSRYWQSIKPS